ncbi:MAG: alpha/beta hydrolase [Flavobacteriales bacterium]|nr:alpha/beta hydrolase [Flavobacteriales bacterium]
MLKRKTSMKIPPVIKFTASTLEKISPKLALKFGLTLFYKPIKFPRPHREDALYESATKDYFQHKTRNIRTYEWLRGDKKVLLVHGWSGRGTQMNKIIEGFLSKNISVYSFDAPAHGESEGKTTHMYEFVESIQEMEKKFGIFDLIIGHSMGGVATLNAVHRGVDSTKVAIIGTPNLIRNVISDFCMNINFSDRMIPKIVDYIEERYNESIDSVSSEIVGDKIDIPVLIIHDEDDVDVQYSEALAIKNKVKKSELFTTKRLGHRLVLANEKVVEKLLDFI